MSTKTSFKRIAAVAALALTLGGFSAVSANAAATTGAPVKKSVVDAVNSVTCAQTLTVTGTTTVTAGATCNFSTLVTAGMTIITNTDGVLGTVASVTSDTVLVLAAAATNGNHAVTAAKGWAIGNLATTTANGIVANQINGISATAGGVTDLSILLDAVAAGTELARVVVGGVSLGTSPVAVVNNTNMFVPFTAPITGGTYNASVLISLSGTFDPTVAGDVTTLPLTITVSAAAVLTPSRSLVFQSASGSTTDAQGTVAPNATNTAATFGTVSDALTYSVSKTLGTNASTIQVALVNSNGTAASQLNTVAASVSGPGLVLVNASAAAANGTARSSSSTATGTNNVFWIHVSADGTAGVGTVTITVTDAITGASTVLGTRSQTYTGSVSKIAVSSSNFTIGAPGKVTGKPIAARDATLELGAALANDNTVETMPAFVVSTTDGSNPAAITAANATVPTVTSSDTTVVSTSTCVVDTTTSANRILIGQGGAIGFYNCGFTSAVGAASGSKATLTISTPSTTAGVNLTTTLVVTIGSSTPFAETITTDAGSYAPGNQMLVTVTAKDSAGNPVADGTASPKVTANRSLGISNIALVAGFYSGGANSNASSIAKSGLFAPSINGEFTLTATSGNAAASTITASANVDNGVGDSNASLALDAANAATDAANNAYDEAQNATQAASDALAAVTALAAQVKSLIASVKKLTAAVAKLKK